MSFEGTLKGPATTTPASAGTADTLVPAIFESARHTAAKRMDRALANASKRLLKRRAPTSLAAVTSGTDSSTWHFVAQSLGWTLESDDGAAAFLTVDGRICFYRQSRTFGGDEFLSVDTVLSTYEGGTATEQLVNPEGLVPTSGRVVSLPARKPGKKPPWVGSPQRLVEFDGTRVIVRWPRTFLDSLVNVDFDRNGKVWVTYADRDHPRSILLKEWLADPVV